MEKLSELPFISISKENLMAASDMLDTEQKGELMEMIIDAVLNNGNPTSSTKCVNGVFNQFMAVIERKSKSYFGRKKHIDDVNDQKKQEKEQPIESNQEFNTEASNSSMTQTMSCPDPAFNFCVQALQDIRLEKGDYEMTEAANKMEKEYGYSTRDLCCAARGY